jgi:capsule polysaccharide export protein KpsE/RkpR
MAEGNRIEAAGIDSNQIELILIINVPHVDNFNYYCDIRYNKSLVFILVDIVYAFTTVLLVSIQN